jgi:hypothetical protein
MCSSNYIPNDYDLNDVLISPFLYPTDGIIWNMNNVTLDGDVVFSITGTEGWYPPEIVEIYGLTGLDHGFISISDGLNIRMLTPYDDPYIVLVIRSKERAVDQRCFYIKKYLSRYSGVFSFSDVHLIRTVERERIFFGAFNLRNSYNSGAFRTNGMDMCWAQFSFPLVIHGRPWYDVSISNPEFQGTWMPLFQKNMEYFYTVTCRLGRYYVSSSLLHRSMGADYAILPSFVPTSYPSLVPTRVPTRIPTVNYKLTTRFPTANPFTNFPSASPSINYILETVDCLNFPNCQALSQLENVKSREDEVLICCIENRQLDCGLINACIPLLDGTLRDFVNLCSVEFREKSYNVTIDCSSEKTQAKIYMRVITPVIISNYEISIRLGVSIAALVLGLSMFIYLISRIKRRIFKLSNP